MNSQSMSAGKHHKQSMNKLNSFMVRPFDRHTVCHERNQQNTIRPESFGDAQKSPVEESIQRFPKNNHAMLHSHAAHQSGAVLVVSLIMLLLLTLIGTTAMQTTSLEEKMAGNMRDRSIAFQAAESALRDAERDVSNSVAGFARNISGITNFVSDCGASTTSNPIDDGLCYISGGYGTPIWTTTNMTAAPSVAYGAFTGSAGIPNLSAQPRYIIEGLPPSGSDYYYRITVRAQGANANTVVWLQAVYKQS